MEIKLINTDKLKPFEKNPRINKDAVAQVKKSIEAHGFNQPIVCDLNKVICVGHTRWLAAKELGLEQVPVYLKRMTKAEFIAYNLADNKSSEFSKWDDPLLNELVKELSQLDKDLLEATSFSDAEIEAILDMSDVDEMLEDDKTEVSAHTRNKGSTENDQAGADESKNHQCPKCGFEY